MRLEFEFIQVAMGLRERLSTVPSVNEWQVLFEFCKRQSLLGIGFAAVDRLHEVGVECPSDEECILNEECRMKNEECIENEECRMKNEECSEADDVVEQQLSSIGQQLKEKCVCEPWMICAANEREGRKLLEEIMTGGNFGQYDERGKVFKNGGMVKHGLWKLKRVMRLVRSYPEEAMWEPMFRVYHLIWRLIH